MNNQTLNKAADAPRKENICIYSRKTFGAASGEHILQNFLGARWTSDSIVCDEVQQKFGGSIDSAFEKGIRPIRRLIGTKGGRGGEAPPLKGLKTTGGQVINLESGGSPQLARPDIQVEKISESQHSVSMTLDPKHAAWAAAELKNLFPQSAITAEDILKEGKSQQGRLEKPVKIEIRLGGAEYIRGATNACFNLLAAHHVDVLSSAFDPVHEFILNGTGSVENFFRWPKQPSPNLPKLGAVDHFIGVRSKGKLVEGVLVLYGHISHSLRFATQYTGPQIRVGYLVDPLRVSSPAENRQPNFADDTIIDFELQPLKPGPETWAAAKTAFHAVASEYGKLRRN